MISNRNDIFRCLIIGSCLFIFWGVIIIWIVSYQNLCHALYLTLYFSKYSGVTIFCNSTRSMPWDVPINWNMSSNWHQRVAHTGFSDYLVVLPSGNPHNLATPISFNDLNHSTKAGHKTQYGLYLKSCGL